MRYLFAAVFLLVSLAPARAGEVLAARPIDVPLAIVPDHGPWDFDLIDLREAERLARLHVKPAADVDSHTFFIIKHHVGFAGGYDDGIAHATVGYYVTVAEWKKWNFGVPAIEMGVGRYPMIDRLSQQVVMKDQVTFMVSVSSAHYRVGYIQTWGLHCYLNLEQAFDIHTNRMVSQFGVSFSPK